jgi:cytoskeletal protein CcmA (bactofilin family)
MSSSQPDAPPDPARTSLPASRPTTVHTVAYLGPRLRIKGDITGDEDLQIDSEVDGSVSLGGHRLTVGTDGHIGGEIAAREVVIYGQVNAEIRARDRLELKKDGSLVGDVATARIAIEEGAYFKGAIEIDKSRTQIGADLATVLGRSEQVDKNPNPPR